MLHGGSASRPESLQSENNCQPASHYQVKQVSDISDCVTARLYQFECVHRWMDTALYIVCRDLLIGLQPKDFGNRHVCFCRANGKAQAALQCKVLALVSTHVLQLTLHHMTLLVEGLHMPDHLTASNVFQTCILTLIPYRPCVLRHYLLLVDHARGTKPGVTQSDTVFCASCQQQVAQGCAKYRLPALGQYGWFCQKCQGRATLRGAILWVSSIDHLTHLQALSIHSSRVHQLS